MSNLSAYGYGASDTEFQGVSAYGYGHGVPVGLLANLDLLTTLTGSLEVPSSTVPVLQSALDLEVDFGVTLYPLIAELVANLDLEIDFTATLSPIAVLLASLDLTFGDQVVFEQPPASVKALAAALNLEVDLVTAFLVPKKIIIDQESHFEGFGPVPPGFLEWLKINGPISTAADMGAAPPEYLEYLKKGGAFSKGGYMYVPVLDIQFKPSDDGAEINPRLIVIGQPQEVSYKPKKQGGATLWKP